MAGYCVGLSGGIASGKSEVARLFATLGVTVADADVAARDAVALGSEGLDEVVAAFGTDLLQADGALDRLAMRRRVYEDPDARKRLEAIVHPRVRAALQSACAAAPSAYAIAAIPLLAESGNRVAYPWLDRILIIDVSPALQRTRLLQRDRIDATLAERMIAAQASRLQRLALADDVIVNDDTRETLDAQVAALDARYRVLASAQIAVSYART